MKTYKINHKTYEVSDEKFNQNTKAELNENATLQQIKGMIGNTRGFKKAPSANYLRCCGEVVAAVTSRGCRIEVYKDGFAVYQTADRAAVVRMDYVGKAWYEGDPSLERGNQCIDLSDTRWTVGVMLSAEDRLERWSRMRDDVLLVSLCAAGGMDEETGTNTELEVNAGVDVEEEVVKHAEATDLWKEIAKALTDRQMEIVRLYYQECLTHSEIAHLLGIERPVVSIQLKRVKAKIKKVFEKNF